MLNNCEFFKFPDRTVEAFLEKNGVKSKPLNTEADDIYIYLFEYSYLYDLLHLNTNCNSNFTIFKYRTFKYDTMQYIYVYV